ncbi:MAG TPA: GntR family transcriptional regulator [Steroidobacteraceae bacterium]
MTPETIASELRRELMTGVLRPGADLSQVDLARRFGVSRIPIRDALRILAGEGLIRIEANRGARALTLTPSEVREIYDLRILLECDCLRRAAAAITPATLQDIDRVRLKSDLDAGGPDWALGDWAFHRAIYLLARRNRQLAMIETLRRTCLLFVSAYVTMPAKNPRWLSDHRAILQCLRKGEPERAVRVLQHHLEGAAQHLLARMAAAH